MNLTKDEIPTDQTNYHVPMYDFEFNRTKLRLNDM